jgi:hypothetical protein
VAPLASLARFLLISGREAAETPAVSRQLKIRGRVP